MLDVRLFPEVLSDLNFFNVHSSTELGLRLRAVQRVAAAAIGAYLFLRYEPILIAKLGSTLIPRLVVPCAFITGYCFLSYPSTGLVVGGVFGYRGVLQLISCIEDKKIIGIGLSVGLIFSSYCTFQTYKEAADVPLLNLLEKLFQRVETRYTQSLWDRFYKK